MAAAYEDGQFDDADDDTTLISSSLLHSHPSPAVADRQLEPQDQFGIESVVVQAEVEDEEEWSPDSDGDLYDLEDAAGMSGGMLMSL